jgi:endonuclease/exonuclease/phosphatase family metal-dependent hydrolase
MLRQARAQRLERSPSRPRSNSKNLTPEKPVTLTVCLRVLSTCAALVFLTTTASAQTTEVVLHTSTATTSGNWARIADTSAAGSVRLANTDRGAAKVTVALASPVDFFELTFQASAGVPYRLWMRGKAAANSYANDSAYVQFSDSVTSTGQASYRIGSTAATVYTIEDCSGCGVSGWGWNDNYYGSTAGTLIYFATTGTHRIRVQVREDGLSLDQIVLSPVQYRSTAPGLPKNDATILAPSGASSTPTLPPPPPPPPSGGNLPPVFESGTDGFRISALQGSLAAPATMFMSASATGPESTDTLTYTWTFGDGSAPVSYRQSAEASRQNAVHTYTTAGSYTARVSIADQAGNVVTRSGVVVVSGPAASASSAATLKVMQLNTYKGRTTDTRTEQSKVWLQARWMASSNADAILLQEVMGTVHANKYKAELEAVTGVQWSYFYRSDSNSNSTTAQGIAIFTRKPIVSTASMAYAVCSSAQIPQRAAIAVTINVNGRYVTLIDTHLSSYNTSPDKACRSAQARQLTAWAQNLGPIRIITGDLNAETSEDAIQWLLAKGTSLYRDTWAPPASGWSDRRLSYPDNPVSSMKTRGGRIDYILTSKDAPLDLLSVQVPDTRDYTNDNSIPSQGQTSWAFQNAAPRLSDHETLVATFIVR